MGSRQSSVQRAVHRLVCLAITAPWLTVLSAVVVAVMALWYTGTALEFITSRAALASSTVRYVQLEDELDEEFDKIGDIVVVIEAPHPEYAKQYVETLASRLRADTQHIERVVEKIDTSSLEGKKLLYLSPEELHDLQQRLEDAQDLLFDLAETPGLGQLLTSINQEIAQALVSAITGGLLASPTSKATSDSSSDTTSEASLDVSFLAALFGEMERAITTPATYLFRSPWDRFFLADSDVLAQEGYLTAADDRFFLVLVDDHTTENSFVDHAHSLRAIRSHIGALQRDFPDVRVGVTGGDALNTDEMLTVQRDTLVATILALVGVAVLYG